MSERVVQQMSPEVSKGKVKPVLSTDTACPLVLVHPRHHFQPKVTRITLCSRHTHRQMGTLLRRNSFTRRSMQ